MSAHRLAALVLGLVLSAAAWANRSPAAEGAYAYIISPSDGETVPATFVVRFGLAGMGVAPAGVEREHTGHHHLLIDVEEMPPMDKPLPSSDQVRHFGKGQTEVMVTLPPGEHTLQMLLGNHLHVPHDPPVSSKKIRVTVLPPPAEESSSPLNKLLR